MSFKAVACDLDGTLLTGEHSFSNFTRQIVQKVQEKEIEFIIATGRHYVSAFKLMRDLKITTSLIACNGARVYNETGSIVSKIDIKVDTAKKILKSFDYENHSSVRVSLYIGDNWISSQEPPQYLIAHYKEAHFLGEVKLPSQLDSYKEISKIIFSAKNENEIIPLLQFIENNALKDIIITMPNSLTLEINNIFATKGQALKKILCAKNINLKDVIAFGDGSNDYDMLKIVGKGLVMGNAHASVKSSLSELEVIEKNSEEGVAKYLALALLK